MSWTPSISGDTIARKVKLGPITLRFDRPAFGFTKYDPETRTFNALPAWLFTAQLGKGGGYRWKDAPWHGMSVHDPWWKTKPWISYIPGITFRLGRQMRRVQGPKLPAAMPFAIELRKNGRCVFVPGWWR